MLFSPTAMGITGFTGLPSATHFRISPATCQGQAAAAVSAFAGILWWRPQAPGIICASQFACLQKILNTADRCRPENLHANRIYASSHDASVPAILLHDPECAFRLNRTVHPKQGAPYALQVLQNLPVHSGQLLVDPHRPVFGRPFALFCMRTARAVIAFIDLFLSAIVILFDVLPVSEHKCPSLRTVQRSVFIDPEVLCAVGILTVRSAFVSFLYIGNFMYLISVNYSYSLTEKMYSVIVS